MALGGSSSRCEGAALEGEEHAALLLAASSTSWLGASSRMMTALRNHMSGLTQGMQLVCTCACS